MNRMRMNRTRIFIATLILFSRVSPSCLLALPAAASSATTAPATPSSPKAVHLTDRQRATRMLNRFAFGPRPGDVDRVIAMGWENWFEQQLNPQQISDGATDKRLAAYPAISFTPPQLIAAFPENGSIQQIIQGKREYSADPLVAGVEQVWVRKAQQQKQLADAAAAAPVNSKSTPDELKAEQARADQAKADQHKKDLASAAEIAFKLLQLPKSARMAALMHLPVDDRITVTSNGNLSGADSDRLLADFSPRERELWNSMAGGPGAGIVTNELMQAKIVRAILSERQLQEVMTDFWYNHFNVFIYKDRDPYYTASYERDAIRPHALGKFSDLLLATAKHPAMLIYLDNASSTGPDSIASGGPPKPGQKPNPNRKGLNENYAREVMELHTVGVNGGYSQQDVTQLARILTGWTIDHQEDGGGFIFDPKRHEPGAKQWFGQTIHEEGYNEGLKALTFLASRPQTANFISYKLAQRFVSDKPPPALVKRMAATFLSSNGDIKEVLRTMVHSPEFWDTGAVAEKHKTPLEFVASAFRATDTDPAKPAPLAGSIGRMGMPLYQKLTPDGYAMTADHWISSDSLLDRLNFALDLANGKIGGMRLDAGHLIAESLLMQPASSTNARAPSGQDQTILLLEEVLIGGEASARTNAAIRKELAAQMTPQMTTPAITQPAPKPAAASASAPPAKASASPAPTAMPVSLTSQDMQKSMATAAALVLGSPEFQLR